MSFPERVVDVGDSSQLPEVVTALSPAKEVAIDVEADSMHHFKAKLCFVQLGTDADIFLMDTLKPGVSPKSLDSMFSDASVTKFFHAAGGDLQYLAEAGVRVKGLFDTHRAATLLGWPKVGLADLVKEKLGQTLKKEHQQADFSLRPLPPELREYIADDVRYLCDVGRWVREACGNAGVLEEVLLDCQRMCDDAAARPDAADFTPKLPRNGLSKDQYTMAFFIARELHALRLQWAEKEDLPTGRVLSNMALGELSTRFPNDVKSLSKLAGVRGQIVREHGEEILGVISRVVASVSSGELKHSEDRGTRDPKKKRREELLLEWRKKAAVERKVTPSVVLSNALVEELATTAPASPEALEQVPYFGQKRLALYGDVLLGLLSA